MSPPCKKRKMSSEEDESPAEIVSRNVAQLAKIEKELDSVWWNTSCKDPLRSKSIDVSDEAGQILGRVFLEKSEVFPIAVWQVSTTHHFAIGHPEWLDPTYAWCEEVILEPKCRSRGVYFSLSDAKKRALHLKECAVSSGKVEVRDWLPSCPSQFENDPYNPHDATKTSRMWALKQVEFPTKKEYARLHSIVCYITRLQVEAPGRMEESCYADDIWGEDPERDEINCIRDGLRGCEGPRKPYMYDPVTKSFRYETFSTAGLFDPYSKDTFRTDEEGSGTEDDEAEEEKKSEVEGEVEKDAEEDEEMGDEADDEKGEDANGSAEENSDEDVVDWA